jgi:CheY-like chemotaxis protein
MTTARVLVVDDNELNLELVRYVLESGGLQVDSVADAEQALSCLALGLPDLILMDIQLPGMDGLALTRRLKAEPATRHLPIIAFTAYAMSGDELNFLKAGCDGYLSKPIDVRRFADQVRAFLSTADPPR